MSPIVLDGKEVSLFCEQIVAEYANHLASSIGVIPHLCVLQVKGDAASDVYVRNKTKKCERNGIKVTTIIFDENVMEKEVVEKIQVLNKNPSVHGILLQLPVPKSLDAERIIANISPNKDVDGLSILNAGRLMHKTPYLVPCTPLGVVKMLDYYNIPLEGKSAVILGRSNLVGSPLAAMLTQKNVTVTLAHSKTDRDYLKHCCQHADIIISAVGKQGIITPDMIGSTYPTLIDVGINRDSAGKLVGDIDPHCYPLCSAYTPVPGGVGQMTTAMLAWNTVIAAYNQ